MGPRSPDGASKPPSLRFLVESSRRVPSVLDGARDQPRPTGPSAVLVVHGMGQQTKFETLDLLVQGLVRAIGLTPFDQPRARLVELAGERLHRVELKLRRDGREHELHLYEAYWAPLTEGQVTLRDVVYLLSMAAVNGIRNGSTEFCRWLFHSRVTFPPQIRTVIALIIGLLALFALVVINLTIGVVAAARWALGIQKGLVGDGLYGDLSTTLNVLFVLVALFGVVLGIGRLARGAFGFVRLAVAGASIAVFALALAVTIATGVAIPLFFFLHSQPGPAADLPLLPSALGLKRVDLFDAFVELAVFALLLAAVVVAALAGLVRFLRLWWAPPALESRPVLTAVFVLVFALLMGGLAIEIGGLTLTDWDRPKNAAAIGRGIVWVLLVVVSFVVRRVMVQYVGDLAAYVQPHALDRFKALRDEIKAEVYKSMRAIYRAGSWRGFTYERIAVVGHSLGSVIAYDVLNQLINEDELAGDGPPASLDTVKRTSLFLTFGSPLDKTAFAFAAQREQSETRYALAATAQPLIRDTSLRPAWINVYSPWDLISGALEFYDPPRRPDRSPDPKAVCNKSDPDARTLFLAHLEYWEGTLVFQTLLEALAAGKKRVAAPARSMKVWIFGWSRRRSTP
jgi:hypothetical protein